MIDFIIVGSGLAGVSFANIALEAGKKIFVFDNQSQPSSTVAGGMYNPVVLKRFTEIWKAQEQLDITQSFYPKLQEKLNEVFDYPTFSHKDLSWHGTVDKKEVNDFIETPFDLLVNYYDVNKSGLLLLSTKSKAKFKVGFDTVDKRVNHFIIKSLVENYNEFVLELFKYLKILNKI